MGPSPPVLAAIVRLIDCVVAPAELLAWSMKLYVPADDGVPLSAPLAASVKPGGSVPDQRLHVMGAVPVADRGML
jgi:hypothetical protein